MKALRGVFRPWVIVALVGWSVLVLLFQTFKGGNVGGLTCIKDPTCGEDGWVPVAVWVAGGVLILVLAHVTRRRET